MQANDPMTRSLPSVMIRLASPADVPSIAALNVRSWQTAYRGHISDGFLNALDPAQGVAWWSQVVVDPSVAVLVAVDSTSLIGFCSFLASRDDDAPHSTCELATLYVDPGRLRAGCGTALVSAVIDMARERAFQELSLWVLSSNSVARAFYEAIGFTSDGHFKTDSRLGISLCEVRYRRNLASSA